ncbi:MAG: hypothetical protein LBD23_17530 [Oscillospiraceae bacterium]|jgi:hypothetical protein|nr:hypothetical protein [Oscillospiraceae bacterium]
MARIKVIKIIIGIVIIVVVGIIIFEMIQRNEKILHFIADRKNIEYVDYLTEDDEYTFIFIVYPNDSHRVARYVIFHDKTLKYTEGSTLFHVFGRVSQRLYPIDTPFCFTEINISEQTILSDEDFEMIVHLADEINAKKWEDEYNYIIQGGGFRHFISYNGYYRDLHGFFTDDEGETYRNEELIEIRRFH